jgi:hypothetical protein
VVAVLQGWSKNNFSGRMTGMAFIFVLGVAAAWGVRTLMGAAH